MVQPEIKQTTRGIRAILYVASILVLAVSVSLYFLPTQTELYFSHHQSPLTAAFLGAGYLTSFLLEFMSAREKIWARARPAIPAVWAFTFLTLIVTLIHLDRFHFNSSTFITVAGTWVWLAVYVSVPIATGIVWIHQMRQPGMDPPRTAPLRKGIRWTLGAQGAIMLILGVLMLIASNFVIAAWPWTLSALTCRAIGAWGVGIGLIALQAVGENDWWRLFPMMMSYALYGLLQLINLLRFSDTLEWHEVSAIFYIVFMISILAVGAFGTWQSWLVKQSQEAQ